MLYISSLRVSKFDFCVLEFDIGISKILLTACADQLLYNLNLIMFGMYKTKRRSKNCKRCLAILAI